MTTYRLQEPILEGGQTIVELEVRALRVGDIRDLEMKFSGDGGASIRLGALADVVGSVLGRDPGFVDKLSLADGMAIGALIAKGFPGLPS